jgi:hypothetical protein
MANKRDDKDYEIEALSKGLAILEALEGTNFEPVKLSDGSFSVLLYQVTLSTVRSGLCDFAAGPFKTNEANGRSDVGLSGSLRRPGTDIRIENSDSAGI